MSKYNLVYVYDRLAEAPASKPVCIKDHEISTARAQFERMCKDPSHPYSVSPQDYIFFVTEEIEVETLSTVLSEDGSTHIKEEN